MCSCSSSVVAVVVVVVVVVVYLSIYPILFYSILFYSILVYSILFSSLLFYSIRFDSIDRSRSIYLSILSYLILPYLIYLSIHLSIYPSTHLFYLSIYLPIYLSLSLSLSRSIDRSICLPASLKMKLFCETSSIFELDNIRSAASLQDFLNFWTWQHQKQSYSARLPQFFTLTTSKTKHFCETSFKTGKLSAELTASYQCILWFSIPSLYSTPLAAKKWCQVIRSAAPVTQNHLSKPEDLMLQNATPLRKSAPRLPNISDEHVSCTAPATRNASFQILFKCPLPAIVFRNATKFSCVAYFWHCTESLVPATQNHIWTFKSGPTLRRFLHFDFEMCFAPQRRALFRHLNFQKWSEPGVFCTFWLGNMLRATTACSFSTSQLPKVVRSWGVLYINLTCKCASRHNGVQFLISHLARAPHPPL